MKKTKSLIALAGLTLVLSAHPIWADDAEAEAKVTDQTSKNPVTGTVKRVKKAKRSHKNADGSSAETTKTDTTKTKTDGTVQTESNTTEKTNQ